MGTTPTKRLSGFNAAGSTSGTDVLFADQGSGEVKMTALQLVAYALTWLTSEWLNQRLMQWAYTSACQIVSATRDTNEAIVTASIVWPDGRGGTFTTDTASTLFPGAIDAWHATYVNGSITKTVTQTAITRDAAGAVTAQPAITIV